jgi:hypothetical protein
MFWMIKAWYSSCRFQYWNHVNVLIAISNCHGIHTFEFMYAEVITSAEFHPTHCNILAYSSSRGSIRLVDMRQSALCDSHSKL